MLIASLDEREYNAESAADVKRAFIHLAPTTVRSHPATDPAVNVMQLKVNFAKKYWLSADEGADEVWPHVKEWLAGKRYFVGENIKSFNKSRGERGEQTVDYREIDLLMAKNVVRFAVEPGTELPVFEDVAAQLRDLCNAGTFGEGPVEVCLPSAQSLAAQRAAWQSSPSSSTTACGAWWQPMDASASLIPPRVRGSSHGRPAKPDGRDTRGRAVKRQDGAAA